MQFAEGVFTASIRLIDTKTGNILASVHIESETVRGLRADFALKSPRFFEASGLAANGQAEGAPKYETILVVETAPAGALMQIDGQGKGAAPLAVEGLAPGTHRVSARLDEYLPGEKEVDVKAKGTTRTTIALQPLTGKLSLTSREACSCTVGPKQVSIAAGGLELVELPVGPVAVRCEAAGHKIWSQSMVVRSDKRVEASVQLKADLIATATLRFRLGDKREWEVRSADGTFMCALPCDVPYIPGSHLSVVRRANTVDESAVVIPVPDSLPFEEGAILSAVPRAGYGRGYAIGLTVGFGVSVATGIAGGILLSSLPPTPSNGSTIEPYISCRCLHWFV